MRTLHLLLLLSPIFAAGANGQAAAPAGFILKFVNQRPDAATLPAFITFGGPGALTGENLETGAALQKGTPYLLSDLSAGALVSQFDAGGRIFVSLGVPLATATLLDSSNPNFSNPLRPDFTTRWDQIALTYSAGSGAAHLSSQDFFGIPLQITTQGGGLVASKLSWHADAVDIFHNLAELAGNSVNTVQTPAGAVVVGSNGVPLDAIGGEPVIRVLGPGAVAPLPSGGTVYPSYASYIAYLQTRHRLTPGLPVQTFIAGHNGTLPDGGPRQTYNVTGTFATNTYALKESVVHAGDLVLAGTVNNGTEDQPLTILVRAANLTDSAISRTNVEYALIEGANLNGVVAKICSDFLTGMNLGLVGSTVDNPAMPGQTLGESPSWTWFGGKPDGGAWPALNLTSAFAAAQPNYPSRYNRYASYLDSVSETYTLLSMDRLQAPMAPLRDGSTLTLTILADTKKVEEAPGPDITFASAATYTPNERIAPGSLAVAWGELPVGYQVYAPGVNVPVPTKLPGLKIRFNNGQLAPLLTANSQVAAFQVPWEMGDTALESAVLLGPDGESHAFPIRLAAYAPGIFAVDNPVLGQGHIYHLDGSLADTKKPAETGEDVLIYCTGLGPVNQQPVTGEPGSAQGNQTTILPPAVTIGGVAAPVIYSGLSPAALDTIRFSFASPAAAGEARESL